MMKKVTLGDWEFEVDTQATKAYYESFQVADESTQCYRNYAAYCWQMSEEEQQFFQALCIDPRCCNVRDAIGLTKEKTYPASGEYYFVGRCIKKAPEILMTIEELVAKNYVDDRPDPTLYIGHYHFTFLTPDSLFGELPEDAPDGFLGVEFFAEEVPWLLRERAKHKEFVPPKPWQIIRRCKRRIHWMREDRRRKNELISKLIQLFQAHDIPYTRLPKKQVESYMNQWFEAVMPPDKQEEARAHCFPTKEYNAYLWHAFSFDDVDCKEDEEAQTAFQQVERGGAVLLMNYDKLAFALAHTAGITAQELDGFYDVLLTEKDFRWCYVHTHEEYCGPYFYAGSARTGL